MTPIVEIWLSKRWGKDSKIKAALETEYEYNKHINKYVSIKGACGIKFIVSELILDWNFYIEDIPKALAILQDTYGELVHRGTWEKELNRQLK